MSPELLLINLANYSWQLVALIAIGIAMPIVFRMREPRSHLLYLQLLLLAALLLPALQPWTQPIQMTRGVSHFTPPMNAAGAVAGTVWWIWQEYVLTLMAAGAGARLLWIALGLWRLSSYRENAQPIQLAGIAEARIATLTHAQVSQSNAVSSPVTFGYLRPVVLLPASIAGLSAEAQFAVVAHELLHVRRGDWLFALAEELIVTALWWHPAIWFLVARIRLIREQVIDRAVIQLTASPQPYVQALLTLAGSLPQPSLAPSFLRRRNLASRIQNLLTEVTMSRTRLIATYSLITALATATAWLSINTFPLQAAPQFDQSNSGVTGAEVVLRKSPVYPSLAKRKGIEGSVVVEATIAENGSVSDARVISGPLELRRAALEAVLQWQFKNGPAAQVTLNFSLMKDGGLPPKGKLAAIKITDGSPAVIDTLKARLAHLEGQPLNPIEISEIVRAVAPSLGISFNTDVATNDVTLTIGNPSESFAKSDGMRLRVGANVQQARLVSKTVPGYPPLAKQARIQGTVRFNALIGPDGHVKNLRLESGHPLLIESAMVAVQQWVYQPTLLNGNPVEVVTSIDVEFTLNN